MTSERPSPRFSHFLLIVFSLIALVTPAAAVKPEPIIFPCNYFINFTDVLHIDAGLIVPLWFWVTMFIVGLACLIIAIYSDYKQFAITPLFLSLTSFIIFGMLAYASFYLYDVFLFSPIPIWNCTSDQVVGHTVGTMVVHSNLEILSILAMFMSALALLSAALSILSMIGRR